MEASELRIGNLVMLKFLHDDEGFELQKVNAQNILCIYEKNKSWIFNPIPITEEWLLNFGFGKKNGYPYKFLNGFIKIRDGIFFYKYYNLDIELKTVHQLQNLYFALTNEELKLKK